MYIGRFFALETMLDGNRIFIPLTSNDYEIAFDKVNQIYMFTFYTKEIYKELLEQDTKKPNWIALNYTYEEDGETFFGRETYKNIQVFTVSSMEDGMWEIYIEC